MDCCAHARVWRLVGFEAVESRGTEAGPSTARKMISMCILFVRGCGENKRRTHTLNQRSHHFEASAASPATHFSMLE